LKFTTPPTNLRSIDYTNYFPDQIRIPRILVTTH